MNVINLLKKVKCFCGLRASQFAAPPTSMSDKEALEILMQNTNTYARVKRERAANEFIHLREVLVKRMSLSSFDHHPASPLTKAHIPAL